MCSHYLKNAGDRKGSGLDEFLQSNSIRKVSSVGNNLLLAIPRAYIDNAFLSDVRSTHKTEKIRFQTESSYSASVTIAKV